MKQLLNFNYYLKIIILKH